MKLKTVRELNTIRGKMVVGHATMEDMQNFLTYVTAIEGLVEEASIGDFYGTEGWQHKIGLEEE